VRIGLSIGELGTSWNLVRLIGPGRAAELAFTGRTVRAAEAQRIGLADRLAETESALEAAIELAEAIAENSDDSVRSTKNALVRNLENNSFQSALEMDNRGQALAFQVPGTRSALANPPEQAR
jgi:enoyl-CoA hydratase/carnithine racemase